MADKVTLKQFSEKLNEYKNGSAARKAIGRFNGWSEDAKNKARKMIDAKFGTADAKPSKPAKAAKAPKAAAKAPATRTQRAPRVTKEAAPALPDLGLFRPMDPNELMGKRFIAERAIQTCAVVVSNARSIHADQPSLDLTQTYVKIIEVQNRALGIFSKELDGVEMVSEKLPTARRPRTATATPAKETENKSNGKSEQSVQEVDSDDFSAQPPSISSQI